MNRTVLTATLVVVAAWLIMIIAMAFLPGCITPNGLTNTQPAPQGSLPDVVSKVVYKTNWLTTAAIVGIALSAAAFVQGAKFALPLFIGCATLLVTILALTEYAEWIAFIGFGIFVLVFAWTIWQKRKSDKALNSAFKEVVTGTQNLKEKILDSVQNDVTDQLSAKKKEINETLAEPQSTTTQGLVKKVKVDLGLKKGTKRTKGTK